MFLMRVNGGRATVEELLKNALDEIAILKAENVRLREENALLREALAIQKKNFGNSSKWTLPHLPRQTHEHNSS